MFLSSLMPGRRRRAAALPAAGHASELRVLGGYVNRGWFARHRRLCFVLLATFCFFYGLIFTVLFPFLPLPVMTPIIVSLAVVIWVLPEQGKTPERLLERLAFAYMVALFTWPDYLAIDLPGLPWITAQRLTYLPMIAVLMYSVSTSAELRARIASDVRAMPWMGTLVITFVTLSFVSCLWSAQPLFSFNRSLVILQTQLAPFLVGVIVLGKPGRFRTLAIVLLMVSLLNIAIGLYEDRIQAIPWVGHIPSFLTVDPETLENILGGSARSFTNVYRVQSRFSTSLGFGEFIALATIFIVHLAVTERGKLRWLAILAIPLQLFILVKVDARSGVIGCIITAMAYLLCVGVLRWRFVRNSLIGPAITLSFPAVALLTLIASFAVHRLRAIVWGIGVTVNSTDIRQEMYADGIPKVLANPIGYGTGRSGQVLGYFTPGGQLTIDTYYLVIALDIGIIGFLAYFGMFAYAAVRTTLGAWHARSPDMFYLFPVAIMLGNFILIKSVFAQQDNHALVFFVLGGAVALLARQQREEASEGAASAGTPALPPLFIGR